MNHILYLNPIKRTNGERLYLSSDGAGNMKLKLWNAKFGPRGHPRAVDPALLFRAVELKEQLD